MKSTIPQDSFQHARQHCTQNNDWLTDITVPVLLVSCENWKDLSTKWKLKKWASVCVFIRTEDGAAAMETKMPEDNLLGKKDQLRLEEENIASSSRIREVVYEFLLVTKGVVIVLWTFPLMCLLNELFEVWNSPCLPDRCLEAASSEAPAPRSRSCCRRAESHLWKPPRWNQWRCDWYVDGSPGRIPGSCLEKRLKTPERQDLEVSKSRKLSKLRWQLHAWRERCNVCLQNLEWQLIEATKIRGVIVKGHKRKIKGVCFSIAEKIPVLTNKGKVKWKSDSFGLLESLQNNLTDLCKSLGNENVNNSFHGC